MLSSDTRTARNGRRFLIFLLLCFSMAIQLGSTSDLGFGSSTLTLSTVRSSTASNPVQKLLDTRRLRGSWLESEILADNSTDQYKKTLISGNSTVSTGNGTFELGFFTVDGGSSWYLGIWYAAVTIRTYVWVANRRNPVVGASGASVQLTEIGRLRIADAVGQTVWETDNRRPGAVVAFLETGNLVLRSAAGEIVWQSFDSPADTWLPGMKVKCGRTVITCWRSTSDPSPGGYSLRLRPPECGEFELIYEPTGQSYWSTGNWTGGSFKGVPEMTVPYIYSFQFDYPYTPNATFVYTERNTNVNAYLQAAYGPRLPLSRFFVDSSGQLQQFTWSPQTQNWNMFWYRPENPCRVFGLCGRLGFCQGSGGGVRNLVPCNCLAGFQQDNPSAWRSGDFSGGCRRTDNSTCGNGDGFINVGAVEFDGDAFSVSISSGWDACQKSCLNNCSCIGLNYNPRTGDCRNLYGNPINFRNSTAIGTVEGMSDLYIKVGKGGLNKKKEKWRNGVLIGVTCGAAMFAFAVFLVAILRRQKRRGKDKDEEGGFPVTNLKVFSYKELQAATRSFSEKLGHGGFGAVFRGELSDSSPVAVKRLERPGGGEREFRAEVCTIGNIQHVNLVRLRGFCSENSHRLLVYDYMENGPLSVFLRRDGRTLSWDVRFRVAVGTARGIAYLHEECRDCIIHCDIKPENILLDGEYTAKVSDFGLAKLVGRDFSRVMTTMRGTWGYVAPEWISGLAITAKADVYSYGMTLLEIIGGRRNVEAPPTLAGQGGEAAKGEDKWFFPPWAAKQIVEGNVANVVDPRLAGEFNLAEVERAALVAVWCIQDEEGARPTMGAVVKMLEGTVEVTVPPTPQLLQALVSGDSFPEGGIASGQQHSTMSGNSPNDVISDVGSVESSVGWNPKQSS